jgi:hypothetical protein
MLSQDVLSLACTSVGTGRRATQITRSGAGNDATLVTQVADHIGG